MTRRGSLAFYMTAVIVGSFFMSATYHVFALATGAPLDHPFRDYFFAYFLTVMLSMLPLLLMAFVLRRLAIAFRWSVPWPWMLCGAALFLALVQALGRLGVALQSDRLVVEWWRMGLTFLLAGPMLAILQPFWLPLPAGTATAFLLYRVHRAFDAKEGTLP